MATDIEAQIDKFVDDTDEPNKKQSDEPAYEPMYRMLSNNRIPISKKQGDVWKSRFKSGTAALKNNKHLDRWDEAIRYYRNDHSTKREKDDPDSQSGTTLATRGMETENLVFANVSALVPAVYAKNPSIEVSMDDARMEAFGVVTEKLVNTIWRTKAAPGVNLKPKARKLVLMTTLTNIAYLEVGYTFRQQSSEVVLADLSKISEQLQKAKKPSEIRELEGKLQALEQQVDILDPPGPWIKFRRAHDVVRDPDADDLFSCNWLMIGDYHQTEMLNALYGEKDEETGEYKSVFQPTHVLKVESDEGSAADDELANFSIFQTDGSKKHTDYGFESKEAFEKAQRTRVWYVWDKTTRRVYLFNENDWKWPLWVWDDPYRLPNFYPLAELSFYDDPMDTYSRSEVTMYLDQQDGINEINNEVAKARHFMTGKALYNKNVLKDEKLLEEILSGTNRRRAVGVDLPPDTDLKQVLQPMVLHSADALNTVMFDKQRLLEAIDRISSVTNVMRGVEFKTNTTNKAIESYSANTQTRLDEKIDAIEDCLGYVGEMMIHLCIQFMDDEMAIRILGQKDGNEWVQMRQTVKEENVPFQAQVVGGSTLKPTSATKKEQAIQLSQALGQFANAAPATVLVMLKTMERAFDDVVITKDDWQMIAQSVEAQLQRGNSEGGQSGQPSEEAGAQPSAESQQASGGDRLPEIERIIDNLPPELKQLVSELIAGDTPFQEIVARVVNELQGAQ